MKKTYLRPLGLVFGPDARAMIDAGKAQPLAGHGGIAFTHIERIVRHGKAIERKVFSAAQMANSAVMARLCQLRKGFGKLDLTQTRLMGIINVTPDSFSDGGLLGSSAAAVKHGRQLAIEGADLLDIGGESTRPGSDSVSDELEASRILPVISGLKGVRPLSADTRKASVMSAALAVGADIINDVSGLSYDAESAGIVARAKCPVVLMHAQGAPKTMQLNPRYDDVLLDVYDGLEILVERALAAGIKRERICIDPGIGFGKSFAQNLRLMAGLTLFHGLGAPLLVGLSRKGFVGAVSGEKLAHERVFGSVGGALHAAQAGAHILRVHDVRATRAALSMFTASHDPDSADV